VSKETEGPADETQDGAPEFVVGVRFHPVGKVYHFDASHHPDLRKGDFVVVTTSRGQQIGEVAVVGPLDTNTINGPLKPVDRQATGRDLAIRKRWENREQDVMITARKLNAEVGLPIKLIKAEYSFDGKQLTFLYSAEERKETKALRKRLSRAFRVKVEMRQIGPRDVAKIIGGYGACGGPRCCAEFLTGFSPISIRMAKAQGISLSPSEITGMCSRLRCCLLYEYEQYAEARKHLPKHGKRVGTAYGEGKVVSLFPLKDTALIDLGDRRVEVRREDIVPLEEWRALQERTAEPCDKTEIGAHDRGQGQAPAEPPPSRSQKARTEPRPRKAKRKPRRPTARRSTRQEKADAQKTDKPGDEQTTRPKSSRRRR
jgi:cell fate regulator YaaT (PSP1 superfamily)